MTELTANHMREKADTAQLIEEAAVKTLGELTTNYSRMEIEFGEFEDVYSVDTTQNAFKIKDSELAHLRKECELMPGAIELLGNDCNALVDTINAVCVRVKAIEDAFRILEESPIEATQEEIGDEELGVQESLVEIGDQELLEFIEMAEQLVLKRYFSTACTQSFN